MNTETLYRYPYQRLARTFLENRQGADVLGLKDTFGAYVFSQIIHDNRRVGMVVVPEESDAINGSQTWILPGRWRRGLTATTV